MIECHLALMNRIPFASRGSMRLCVFSEHPYSKDSKLLAMPSPSLRAPNNRHRRL